MSLLTDKLQPLTLVAAVLVYIGGCQAPDASADSSETRETVTIATAVTASLTPARAASLAYGDGCETVAGLPAGGVIGLSLAHQAFQIVTGVV